MIDITWYNRFVFFPSPLDSQQEGTFPAQGWSFQSYNYGILCIPWLPKPHTWNQPPKNNSSPLLFHHSPPKFATQPKKISCLVMSHGTTPPHRSRCCWWTPSPTKRCHSSWIRLCRPGASEENHQGNGAQVYQTHTNLCSVFSLAIWSKVGVSLAWKRVAWMKMHFLFQYEE